jgi:exoribonuclease R
MAKTHSLKLCYASDYNLEIVKTGATKLAKSREEFRNLINRYLEHPEFESKQRQELRDKFCYKIDGNSGKRFADIVIEETNE